LKILFTILYFFFGIGLGTIRGDQVVYTVTCGCGCQPQNVAIIYMTADGMQTADLVWLDTYGHRFAVPHDGNYFPIYSVYRPKGNPCVLPTFIAIVIVVGGGLWAIFFIKTKGESKSDETDYPMRSNIP